MGHLIQGHIEDLTHTELVIGDSLEVALELGEKHEVFVSTCKEVCILNDYITYCVYYTCTANYTLLVYYISSTISTLCMPVLWLLVYCTKHNTLIF